MTASVEVKDDGNFQINWATEFDIRDSLAQVAELTGWYAETEHVVHGWGRPDIYLSAGFDRYAIEVKTQLATKSACRRAVQQAAGYSRAMPELKSAILVSPQINKSVMHEYEASYPEVLVMTAAEFIAFLRFDDCTLASRKNRIEMALSVLRSRVADQSRAYLGLPVMTRRHLDRMAVLNA